MSKIVIGWDEAARQGACMAGEMQNGPTLTDRKDLGSINHDTKAGWEGATPGTKRRMTAKLGKSEQ